MTIRYTAEGKVDQNVWHNAEELADALDAANAERDTAIRERDALRESLRKYGRHKSPCDEPGETSYCICGWQAISAALKDAP